MRTGQHFCGVAVLQLSTRTDHDSKQYHHRVVCRVPPPSPEKSPSLPPPQLGQGLGIPPNTYQVVKLLTHRSRSENNHPPTHPTHPASPHPPVEAVVLQDVDHARHLTEDEHAALALLEPRQQLVQQHQLAAVLHQVLAWGRGQGRNIHAEEAGQVRSGQVREAGVTQRGWPGRCAPRWEYGKQ